METIRCPRCGLTNWKTESCKRCSLVFSEKNMSVPRVSRVAMQDEFSAGNPTQDHFVSSPSAQPKQGMAIASMVLGLIGCFITSPVGLILGIVAAKRASRSPNEYGGTGFAIAGIVLNSLGVFTLPIIAAIAIPNLLAARRSANEGSAISSVRTLIKAMDYSSPVPPVNCPQLGYLGARGVIEPALASGTRSGYRFEVNSLPNEIDCQIIARPIKTDGTTSTGSRTFFASRADGWQIHFSSSPSVVATLSDPVLESNPYPVRRKVEPASY